MSKQHFYKPAEIDVVFLTESDVISTSDNSTSDNNDYSDNEGWT